MQTLFSDSQAELLKNQKGLSLLKSLTCDVIQSKERNFGAKAMSEQGEQEIDQWV